MRRAAAVFLFVAAILVSVYAWQSLSDAVGLHGIAAVRYLQRPLTWHLRWVLLGFFLSSAFVVVAQGRWRFAAAVPLVSCAFVAWATIVMLVTHVFA